MSECKHDWFEDDCKCCGFYFWVCRKCDETSREKP